MGWIVLLSIIVIIQFFWIRSLKNELRPFLPKEESEYHRTMRHVHEKYGLVYTPETEEDREERRAKWRKQLDDCCSSHKQSEKKE